MWVLAYLSGVDVRGDGPRAEARTAVVPSSRPFATALRWAMFRREVTLAEIRDRLARRGVEVGLSTLSAWRNGVSVPSSRSRDRVVPLLEEALGLSPGTLTGSLAHEPSAATPPRSLLPEGVATLQPSRRSRYSVGARVLLGRLDAGPADLATPTRLSMRYRIRLDAERRYLGHLVSLLLAADAGPATRVVILCAFDDISPAPRPQVVYGGRLGRVSSDLAAGLIAFEVLLDQLLPAGGATRIEYVLTPPRPARVDRHHLRIPDGVRDLSLSDGERSRIVLDPMPGEYELTWPAS